MSDVRIGRTLLYGLRDVQIISKWNELPTDLREPRQTQSPALSPITHGSSSSSGIREPFQLHVHTGVVAN